MSSWLRLGRCWDYILGGLVLVGKRARFGWMIVLAVVGCSEPAPEPTLRDGDFVTPPRHAAVPAPLPAAHCSVDVTGVGTLDLEQDYLPQVIFCENNGANFEALKAQAIAARSVAYYNMETEGSICDSQGCQVFTCNGLAGDEHRAAVEATSGIYLSYNSVLTYGFYVAGDSSLTPPACLGNDADASTERYVTYNEGRSGTNVDQTSLGLVIDPSDSLYGQNRGCMSQWGSRCLENDAGYDALDILRFYYGADIELLQAQGPCITDVDDPMGGSAGTTTDDSAGSDGPPPDDSGPDGGGTSDDGGGEPSSAGGDDDPFDDDDDGADGSSGAEGTGFGGGDSDPSAFPRGYGDRGTQSCACRSDGTRPNTLGLALGLVLLGLRRRRARPDHVKTP